MATRTLVGTNADFENTTNWSGATAPANGDSVLILEGSQTFTTNMDQGDQDWTLLVFGQDWTGKITTTNKLIVGAATAIKINCPNCPELAISTDDAHTTTSCYVYATGTGPYACYLTGESGQTGLFTSLYVMGGNVHLGSTAKVTNLWVAKSAKVWIDSGALITTLRNWGTVYNEAAVTTIYQYGGEFRHQGRTTSDVTTFAVYGGIVKLDCENGAAESIGVLHAYAGFVDGTQYSYSNTINADAVGTIGPTARVWLNQQATITNDFYDYTMGEGYRGPASGTTEMVPQVPLGA